MPVSVKMFSEEDQTILFKSGKLSPAEEDAIAAGKNLTLDLVIKAKRIIEAESIRDLSALVSKTEVNLLIDEINRSMVKVFLLFKLLERKGFVTEQELVDITLEFEEIASKEVHGDGKTKTGSSTGQGRTTTKTKDRKSSYAADRSNVIVSAVSTGRTICRPGKATRSAKPRRGRKDS